MEKEENWLKRLPFKPRQGKKVLIFFVTLNIVIIWFFYYKSSNTSYFYYQIKTTTTESVLIPIYNVSLFHIPLLDAKDMAPFYAEVKSKTWCFLYGIDLIESKKRKKCICSDQWFGLDCGIPSAVWKSSFLQDGKNANIEIRRREKPRRIISSIVAEGHQDVLDINIYNAFSIVDLFLTVEGSNQKPSVLNMVKNGHLAEFQGKIIPVQLNKNISNQRDPKEILLMMKGLWDVAWKRLTDFRPDDLIIFSHTSSIISKEILLFLKLYDGFPEPLFFELRPLLLKFWRLMKTNNTNINLLPFKPIGCTFQYLASMCNFEITRMFTNDCNAQDRKTFEKNNWTLKDWIVGSDYAPSGWQCNLCCKDKCIHTDAKKYDIPAENKKGNSSTLKEFLEKTNLFNSKELSFEEILDSDPFLAPPVVLNNAKKYAYLVDHLEFF